MIEKMADDRCPDELYVEFAAEAEAFLVGSNTLLRALRHIHHGLCEENRRIPQCCSRTKNIVNERHKEAILKAQSLLKAYAVNFLVLNTEYLSLVKLHKKCSPRHYATIEDRRKQFLMQRDLVLHVAENIVKCQLMFMSQCFVKDSKTLQKGDEVFKLIRTFNLVLERLKRCFEYEEQEEEEEVKSVASTSTVSVPSSKKKQLEPPPPPPPPPDKLKTFLLSESLTPPMAVLKKFTASRILQSVGSVRSSQVTEYITEALLSRVEFPAENSESKLTFPWKPVNFCLDSTSHPNMDIFEESLAKEEDENRLNQRKLDMALRQEFGEDFPGADYLPASDGIDAFKLLDSDKMDALIKTNTNFLELLLKKFLNTSGVIVPSLIRTGRYGELRLSKAGRSRLEGYYVDQIWGVGANLVDELVLWSPLILCPDSTLSTKEYNAKESNSNTKNDDKNCRVLETPTSDRSTSSISSDATIINNSLLVTTVPSKLTLRNLGPRQMTLNVDGSHGKEVFSNFLAPPALNIHHLLYLQEVLNKYLRRGVVPGWCVEACESLSSECGHLASQSSLDKDLVTGLAPFAKRQPLPVKLMDGNYSTNVGVGLSSAVQLLVWEIKQVEKTELEKEDKDWPIADLVESLSVLCSTCSSALCWIQLRSQCLLHSWAAAPYYLLTQADLPHILQHLVKVQMEEREYLVKTDDLHRAMLVPYREKLVARTEAFVIAAKMQEAVAVEALSDVCRTVALAQLKIVMPPPTLWQGVGRLPHEPQRYVAEYIGSVLQPVLVAVSNLGEQLQRRAGCALLKVVCYAWLEHFKQHKIKFSLWGAQQLLKDFAALSEWVRVYPGLCDGARSQVLAVDVLRECEGVARLLMRQPPMVVGYSSLNQVAPLVAIQAGREHDKSVKLSNEKDDIPAEMYVSNQALWLKRRTRPASSMCVRSASCCTWPY